MKTDSALIHFEGEKIIGNVINVNNLEIKFKDIRKKKHAKIKKI